MFLFTFLVVSTTKLTKFHNIRPTISDIFVVGINLPVQRTDKIADTHTHTHRQHTHNRNNIMQQQQKQQQQLNVSHIDLQDLQ
jgi:hypothetical protein